MRKKVLVIEDSHLLCHILEEALRTSGFDVVVSHDGKGGLLKAQTCDPDIILLDLVLPDMPGEEVCRDLKKNPATDLTPVIMLTGKDSDVDRVIGKVLGADAYIPKPFDIKRLMKEIAHLLSLMLIAALCVARPLFAADGNETKQVPPGMEVIRIGEHTVYVAAGTKVTRRGSQLVLEPPDEFIARKILALEQDIAGLKEREKELRAQLETLKREIEQQALLKSPEAPR